MKQYLKTASTTLLDVDAEILAAAARGDKEKVYIFMCHSANKDINNAPFPYKRSGTIFFIMPWSKHIAPLGRYEEKQYTKYCPSSFVWERCMR
jgi:hypothetical protein